MGVLTRVRPHLLERPRRRAEHDGDGRGQKPWPGSTASPRREARTEESARPSREGADRCSALAAVCGEGGPRRAIHTRNRRRDCTCRAQDGLTQAGMTYNRSDEDALDWIIGERYGNGRFGLRL